MRPGEPVCFLCRCQDSWKAHLCSAKAGNVNTPAIVEIQHGGAGHYAVGIVRSAESAQVHSSNHARKFFSGFFGVYRQVQQVHAAYTLQSRMIDTCHCMLLNAESSAAYMMRWISQHVRPVNRCREQHLADPAGKPPNMPASVVRCAGRA